MDRDRRLSLTVGGFVLLALVAFAVIVLQLSAQQGVFQPRYPLVAYFDNVQGLVGGAQVWLAGTRVGQVRDVQLGTRPGGEPAVRVELEIDRSVQQRIRADSRARISTVGLLGDQIVEVSIGTTDAAVLAEGGELSTQMPLDLNAMMAEGGEALDSVRSLADRMNVTLAEFQETGGGRNLAQSLRGLGDVIDEVKQGDGVLHSVIYEPYEGTAIASLESSLASVEAILDEVENGEGLLHSLVYDEAGEGGLMVQFLEAGANLNSILGKIDRGEGSLGLLLNDPTLYEELKLLVGGARRNTLVRNVIEMITPGEE